MPPVDVKPWVVHDVARALNTRNPSSSRLVLDQVLFDLHNHLPLNRVIYQPKRISRNPGCFWYERTYASDRKLQFFSFVMRDTDPANLEVIWGVPTPP